MAQSGTFRTALFGGYNRDDVEEYVQNMEHELETVKLLHRKEKLELMRRVEESEGELSAARLEPAASLRTQIRRLRDPDQTVWKKKIRS